MSTPQPFRFKCAGCGEWHEGMPSFGTDAPLYYFSVPERERAARCDLNTDICIVDEAFFFVRGQIEIPVHDAEESFTWSVWVSLSRESFVEYLEHFESADRASLGPYFGWLSAHLEVYPDCENLKTHLHPRAPGLRPLIELEPTDHPLAIEQRNGITHARVAEIYRTYVHD